MATACGDDVHGHSLIQQDRFVTATKVMKAQPAKSGRSAPKARAPSGNRTKEVSASAPSGCDACHRRAIASANGQGRGHQSRHRPQNASSSSTPSTFAKLDKVARMMLRASSLSVARWARCSCWKATPHAAKR